MSEDFRVVSPGILKIRAGGHSSKIRSPHLSPPPLSGGRERERGKKGHNVSCFIFFYQKNWEALEAELRSAISQRSLVHVSHAIYVNHGKDAPLASELELTCAQIVVGSE